MTIQDSQPLIAGWLDLSDYRGFDPQRMAELAIAQVSRDETADIFYAQLANYEPIVHMDRLGLRLYRDAMGNLLLSCPAESLHSHDRWQYFSPVVNPGAWYSIIRHGTTAVKLNLVGSLRADWKTMQALEEKSNTGVGPSYYWRLAHQAPELRLLLLPFLSAANLTAVDMHDLLFHPEVWIARNPEYQRIPGQLVARMHGLGAVVDWLEANR